MSGDHRGNTTPMLIQQQPRFGSKTWIFWRRFLATHQSLMGSSQLNYLLRIFPLSDASWLVLHTPKYPLAVDRCPDPRICVSRRRLSANGSACWAARGTRPPSPTQGRLLHHFHASQRELRVGSGSTWPTNSGGWTHVFRCWTAEKRLTASWSRATVS